MLAVYLLAIVAAFLYLQAGTGGPAADPWPRVVAAYAAYRPEGVSDEDKSARLDRAEVLARELSALRRTGQWRKARAACRELMRLDKDHHSPIYRYAASILARLPPTIETDARSLAPSFASVARTPGQPIHSSRVAAGSHPAPTLTATSKE